MLQVFILLLFGRHLCQQDRGKDQYAASYFTQGKLFAQHQLACENRKDGFHT